MLSCISVLLETTEEFGRHLVLFLSKEKHEVRAKSFRTGAVQHIRHTIVTGL